VRQLRVPLGVCAGAGEATDDHRLSAPPASAYDQPHVHRATASLAGSGLWSSWALLLCQHVLWYRAVPIPTGLTLIVGHVLEPLPCATLGARMQRCMVHGEQVRRRCRRIRGHRERCSSGTIRGLGVPLRHATLSGALVAQHGWYAPARDTGMVVRVGRSDRRQRLVNPTTLTLGIFSAKIESLISTSV